MSSPEHARASGLPERRKSCERPSNDPSVLELHDPTACCAIHLRMSSARHTVIRAESFTGSGKVLA
jgi:hypothetical protein